MPPSAGGAGAPAVTQQTKVSLLRRAAIDVSPLRFTDFRRLWLGQAVSFVGYQVTAVAVPIQIYGLTGSSLWVGLLGVAALVPLIGFGLWGGAAADVLDRRTLVVASSLVTWCATWGLVVQALAHAHSPLLLLGLTAVQSTGIAVSGPTAGAIIPRLVPVEMVPGANTLNFVVQNAGAIAGPLVGAVVVGTLGFAGAYGFDAALFTGALYAMVRLPRIPPLPADPVRADVALPPDALDAAGAASSWPPSKIRPARVGLRSVVDGIAYVKRRPVLLMSFVVDLIAMGLAMPRALFPQVAHERFGGTSAVGWLYASIAIGAVAGGLLSGWVGRVRRQGSALIAAIAGWGVFVALAGLSHLLWLTVLLLAVAGACDLVGSVYRQTILQTYAPDEMRGRLQGVFTVVVTGGPRLGDLRAGAVAAAFGVTASWTGGGLACAVAILLTGAAVPAFARYVPQPGVTDRRPTDH